LDFTHYSNLNSSPPDLLVYVCTQKEISCVWYRG
jgi:hypothetical protein